MPPWGCTQVTFFQVSGMQLHPKAQGCKVPRDALDSGKALDNVSYHFTLNSKEIMGWGLWFLLSLSHQVLLQE